MAGISLSDAASWASLLSLLISICSLIASSYAAFGIRRVRADLVNRATLPGVSKALDDHAANLGRYLENYEQNKNDFAAELSGCEANLSSLHRKITDTTKVNVYPLLWKIARYKGPLPFSRKGPQDAEQNARAIYNGLKLIQQQLKNLLEEQRLGG